ncbi:hypothetical protein ACFY93_09225 [Streptomyces sp. NPDC008313]|uniref:hypothetical protein n=1 Tax=Streptomyces sp. NPDC008313 TaxID=3364826 RepID=UPI0036E2246C
MKSLKAAAVVAGSLVMATAAAPAFAQGVTGLTPTSLNGGLDPVAGGPLDVSGLQSQPNLLDTENQSSMLHSVSGVTDTLNANGGTGRLLGGVPLKG